MSNKPFPFSVCKECCADTGTLTAKDITYTGDYYNDEQNVEDAINFLGGEIDKHSGTIAGNFKSIQKNTADITAIKEDVEEHTTSINNIIDDLAYRPTSEWAEEVVNDLVKKDEKISGLEGYIDDCIERLNTNETLIDDNAITIKESEQASKQIFANALKGSATGEAIALKDTSPVEHIIDVKVRKKNLFPSNEQLSFPTNNNISFDCDIPQPFSLSLTLNIESISVPTTAFIELTYDDGSVLYFAPSIWSYTLGEAKRFNNLIRDNGKILKRVKFLNWGKLVGTVSDMQIEEGVTATAYAPYIEDISTVKLKTWGKNLLNVNDIRASTNTATLEIRENSTIQVTAAVAKNCSLYCRIGKYQDFVGKTLTLSVNLAEVTESATYKAFYSYYRGIDADGNAVGEVTLNTTSVSKPGRFTFTVAENENAEYLELRFYVGYMFDKVGYTATLTELQLEMGTATEYEAYKEPVEYTVNEDGTVTDVVSIYPSITLATDTIGAVIDCEYNRDINKAFAELQQAIISLGGNI